MQTCTILIAEAAAIAETGNPTRTIIREAGGQLTVNNGRIRVRIIDEGQGSSGYFPAPVLEQAAVDRVFKSGTRMHLDHPARSSEDDLPERSVKDWVAVLAEDAVYDPETRALEADATVFAGWRQVIEDLSPYVGVSIRAYATATPDGTITRLTEGLSIDFVTAAGRGGKVLQVLESARPPVVEATSDDRRSQIQKALSDAYADKERYVWLRDYDESQGLAYFGQDNHTWQQAFTVADDDMSISLTGNPVEVQPVTRYLPVNNNAGEALTNETADPAEEGATMPTITEAELSAYKAAEGTVATLTAEAQKAAQERDDALAELTKTRSLAAEALIGTADLPDAAKDRVRKAFEADTSVDVSALLTAEADYIRSVAPAVKPITGFGAAESGTTVRPATTPWGRQIKES